MAGGFARERISGGEVTKLKTCCFCDKSSPLYESNLEGWVLSVDGKRFLCPDCFDNLFGEKDARESTAFLQEQAQISIESQWDDADYEDE